MRMDWLLEFDRRIAVLEKKVFILFCGFMGLSVMMVVVCATMIQISWRLK